MSHQDTDVLLGSPENTGITVVLPRYLASFLVRGLLEANPGAAREARGLASPRAFGQPQPFRDHGGLGVLAMPIPRTEGQPAVPPAPELSTREQACHAAGRAGRAAALWGC